MTLKKKKNRLEKVPGIKLPNKVDKTLKRKQTSNKSRPDAIIQSKLMTQYETRVPTRYFIDRYRFRTTYSRDQIAVQSSLLRGSRIAWVSVLPGEAYPSANLNIIMLQ